VQDAPGRGLLVTPLDVGWMQQVYEVRGALDALAVNLAAAQRAQLDPQLIVRGRLAAESGEVKAMIDADLAFHEAIYAASGNPLIAQSAQLHWRHLRRVMGAVLQSVQQRRSAWDEHEAIAQAIALGDGKHALALISHHRERASSQLTTRLTAHLADTLA
jgi:DNA-binding GntR family transcriptional regulator